MRKKYRHKGFTLLEILLTITLIGILATITLIAINPNRQLGQVRDLNRQKDITDIHQTIALYATKNSGEYPAGIEVGVYKEICGEIVDTNCVDLSILVPNYISSIPKDPNGNNYVIGINPDNNSISVLADNAEQREVAINKFTILLAGAKDPSFDTGVVPGFDDHVYKTAIQPQDNKILLAGRFVDYQGVSANKIIRLNTDGSRDTSFNIGTGFNSIVYNFVIQDDGKIVLVGLFENYQGVSANGIIRLNSDGSRDNSFSIGTGFKDIDEWGETANIYSLDIQNDGKIIVGGDFNQYNGEVVSQIIRLNIDGSRDTSFSIGTGFNSEDGSLIKSIKLQSDGKILAGGYFDSYQGESVKGIVRLNSNGSRDSTFNQGQVGLDGWSVLSITIDNNNKILLGGNFNSYNEVELNDIVRLNNDGSLDNSFDVGTGFDDDVFDIVIQSDGKILVGGRFKNYKEESARRIIRLNSNGSRDTGFSIGTGFNSYVYSISVQNDGKIITGGEFDLYQGDIGQNIEYGYEYMFDQGGAVANRVLRLNNNGSRDNTFDNGNGFSKPVYKLAIQNDGKIIVGGWFGSYKGARASKITRLNPDSSIDTSFNVGNFQQTFGINDIAIQNNGKILVSSWSTPNLVRLNSDGSIDENFDIGTGFNSDVNTLAIQSDGKIIVGGWFSSYQGVGANRIIRLNTDGSIDENFDIGTGFDSGVSKIAIQSDGKILVGGRFSSYQGIPANRMLRLNSDGSRDNSFNIGTGFSVSGNTLALQSDGKIIVGGWFNSNNIIRLNTDGSLDTNFNIGTGFEEYAWIYDIKIQSDGKIIAGGSFGEYNGNPVNKIIRMNQDGSKDDTFDIGTGFSDWGSVYSLVLQNDGKIIVGGQFKIYQNQPAGYLIRIGN